MLYVVDTNVISETVRPKPNSRVIDWIWTLDSMQLPAVVVYELAAGIKRLKPGKKRQTLEVWFAELMGSGCEILAFDRDAALISADLEADARSQRRVIEYRDLFILATAKSRSLGVATRNVEHLRGFGVPVYDPFDDVYLV